MSSSPSAWALLEPYAFRRDDEDCFPDESDAPIRASGTTSLEAPFSVAFSVAEPPLISRIYAQLPGFPGPEEQAPLAILATHRHLALLEVITETPEDLVQDLFIFRANESNPGSSSLIALPPCTEPEFDYYSCGSDDDATPRLLDSISLGLWCGDDQEEFVVAELSLYGTVSSSFGRHINKVSADICMLRGNISSTADDDHQLASGRWNSTRVEILSNPAADYDDLWQLSHWQTHTAIGFQRWLCWIDYHIGILFCDMSAPTVSFLRFPQLDDKSSSPLTSTSIPTTCNIWYSGVSVVHHGPALKFVNVCHHETLASREPKPGTGFTITCHNLVLGGVGGMAWEEDYIVTSDDLSGDLPDGLQCGTLKFPRVDIDRPHVVHFLSVGSGGKNKKMWVVSIDMSTKTVESSYLYVNFYGCLPTDDNHFIVKKYTSPTPFLPCDFPRFC